MTNPEWKAMTDWSGLPDVYVTKAECQQGMFWRIEACSVPMAIGPEVRLIRADRVAQQLADAQAARALVVERAEEKRFRATVKHDGAEVGDLPWLEEFWAVRHDDILALAPIDGLALVRELRAESETRHQLHLEQVRITNEWIAECDRLAAANAVLEAKVAGLLEVVIRVKPLDWQEGRFCGQDMFYAETPSGTWMVVCYSGRGFRWAVCDSQGNNSDEDWSTPELAKAAAQGDYDAEVRAALDLTTGPEQTSGWQPIETAPKDGLIDIWLSEGQRWCDCYYDRICDEWRTSRPSGKLVWIKAKHVTHWRPRTPAPAALATQEAGNDGNNG